MTHVVAFILEPVEGDLRARGAVARDSLLLAVWWIGTTATGNFAFGDGNGAGGTLHVALEGGHEHCIEGHV